MRNPKSRIGSIASIGMLLIGTTISASAEENTNSQPKNFPLADEMTRLYWKQNQPPDSLQANLPQAKKDEKLITKAEQFVELTVEIEVQNWSDWFFGDEIKWARGLENKSDSIFEKRVIRCVIGTNSWLIEGAFFQHDKSQYWFTGTNIIHHGKTTEEYTDHAGYAHHTGENYIEISASFDEKPGRTFNVRDFLNPVERIPWLAFCSGPTLKVKNRHLYPPFDIRKETTYAPHGFLDRTTVFKDDLGLPINMKLFAKGGQPVFMYQVHQSTNMLGWNFPLEFYMVQYESEGTNGRMVRFTSRGKVTAIGAGAKPEIPAAVFQASKKFGYSRPRKSPE